MVYVTPCKHHMHMETHTRMHTHTHTHTHMYIHTRMHTHVHMHVLVHTTSSCYTVYCFCFAVKKFHGLMSFLSFPEKLSRFAVILPILGIIDSNIHGKTFAVTKRSAKTAKLFHRETKAIYGIKNVNTYNRILLLHLLRSQCIPLTTLIRQHLMYHSNLVHMLR